MCATTSTTADKPAAVLVTHLPLLQGVVTAHGILDLACGSGRNGLFLAQHNLPLIFADINSTALQKVASRLRAIDQTAELWEVDLEDPQQQPLAGKTFDAILVFNYLHRPLMQDIRTSLRPGGVLIYETFTVDQASIGRPKNPAFLLRHAELQSWFGDWEVLHEFTGADPAGARHYANLVARKPTV